MPIQSFEEWNKIVNPMRYFEDDSELCNYLMFITYINESIKPRWEKDIKEKNKEFIEEVIKENPDWAKERRLDFLLSILEELKEEINYWTNKLESLPDFLGEYVWEQNLKLLFKKKKGIEFEINGWKNPTKNNNNKITKLDIERCKEIPIKDILGLEPKNKSIGKHFYSAPWRSDSSPSLCVYTNDNTWWDYGENIGGSNIDLVMKLYNLEFIESVKFLLRK